MDVDTLTQDAAEFYNILSNDRINLLSFLTRGNKDSADHKCLKNILTKINDIYKNTTLMTDLFLGKIGPIQNKTSAIYELPTTELLNVIYNICVYFKITHINEMMAGMGLFSSLMTSKLKSKKLNIKYTATDGYCHYQTISDKKYYKVEQKDIIAYLIDKEYDEKKIIDEKKMDIIVWPSTDSSREIEIYVKKVNPAMLIIVGYPETYSGYIKILEDAKYMYLQTRTKQICFRDTHTANAFFPDISHSKIMIFINPNCYGFKNMEHKDIEKKICSFLDEINPEIAESPETLVDDKHIIKMYCHRNIIPYKIIETISGDNIRETIGMLYVCLKKNYRVPKYISSYNELSFWFSLTQHDIYPTHISDSVEFKQFFDIYDDISMCADINIRTCILKYVFPKWVLNKKDALRCTILLFGNTTMEWWDSRDKMLEYFS